MDAKLAAAVAMLVLLGPVACHGATPICLGGWVRPAPSPQLGKLVCPGNLGDPYYPSLKPGPTPSSSALKVGYYDACPDAEDIVRNVVEDAVTQNPGVGAGLIRLFFHDCFVRGCDASMLLRNTSGGGGGSEPAEMFGVPNINSLRGFEVIDAAKAALEAACPSVVSCADTLAFAARDASGVLSGGRIRFAMPAGRLDGRVSLANETTRFLPGPFCDLDALTNFFAAKGLDRDDMVTLSGAHTVGEARCAFFVSNRTDMNATLAKELRDKCRSGGSDTTKVALDYKTPDAMDVQYYQNVKDDDVVLDSDAALRSQPLVDAYVAGSSGNLWETKFAAAMVKMGSIEVKTSPGADAEIRKKCSIYN